MFHFLRRKPRPASPITDRTCITIVEADLWIVIDIIPDGSPNPWGIYVDALDEHGELTLQGLGAHCNADPIEVCNGQTLLDYYLDDVITNGLAA